MLLELTFYTIVNISTRIGLTSTQLTSRGNYSLYFITFPLFFCQISLSCLFFLLYFFLFHHSFLFFNSFTRFLLCFLFLFPCISLLIYFLFPFFLSLFHVRAHHAKQIQELEHKHARTDTHHIRCN